MRGIAVRSIAVPALLALIALVLGGAGGVNAAPVTYYGSDVAVGPNGAHVNSDLAAVEFDKAATALGKMYRFDFEVAPTGSVPVPYAVAPGVTLSGTNSVQSVVSGGSVLTGYNSSEGGKKFLSFGTAASNRTSSLTLRFTDPLQAFGCCLSGIGASTGTLMVSFDDGAAQGIPIQSLPYQGGMRFWGIVDAGKPVKSVSLSFVPMGSRECSGVIGIDDVRWVYWTNGHEPPPSPVPEPGTLALLGSGLLIPALSLRRRHRSAK